MAPSTAQPVLVVGSVAIDEVKTPTAASGRVLGGSASYGAIAASYFAPTRLVGVVGSDFGDSFLDRFRKRKIDLEGLQVDAQGKTFFWSGVYGENFATTDTLEIQLNVFEHFRPDLPEGWGKTPYVMLGNIHPDLQHRVLDQVEGDPFVLADTRDLWINLTKDNLLKLLPRLTLFVLNDEEACLLTGLDNVIAAGRRLLEMGPQKVLIKKGAHGSILFDPEGLFALPAYPLETLADPTGAGDSYAGALIGHLAALGRRDFSALKHAMLFGTAAASLTVETFSVDRLEAAGRTELEERRAALTALISLD